MAEQDDRSGNRPGTKPGSRSSSQKGRDDLQRSDRTSKRGTSQQDMNRGGSQQRNEDLNSPNRRNEDDDLS